MNIRNGARIFLGPRRIKTGIAVAISVFLSGFIPHSLPLLAGAAAVICVQPSITTGIQKGLTRFKSALAAGIFGLPLYYLFGANVLVMGLAVIMLISLYKKLAWEDGIVVGCLTVIAIMSGETPSAFNYAFGRVTSTLVGIAAATVTNIVVAPPRHILTFRQELKQHTISFPEIYLKAVEAFTDHETPLADRVLTQLRETETKVEQLSEELEYLKTGAQSSYGAYLEGLDLREVMLFERGVHSLRDVIAKTRDIAEAAQRRRQRKLDLAQRGITRVRSAEFENLMSAVQDMAQKLGRLHQSVFLLLGEREISLLPEIRQQAEEIDQLKEQVRTKLKNWEIEHIQDLDIFSLMLTHRVIFDLEEIASGLTELAKASISYTGQIAFPPVPQK